MLWRRGIFPSGGVGWKRRRLLRGSRDLAQVYPAWMMGVMAPG